MKNANSLMRFEKFMVTGAGRWTRALGGFAIVGAGLSLKKPSGYFVAGVGLIPLLAGTLDYCVLGPLTGGSFKGDEMRARFMKGRDMSLKSIKMTDLIPIFERRNPQNLILDVRTRDEYQDGHIPHSRNVPVDEIEKEPEVLANELKTCTAVYIHCASGNRAKRSAKALADAGLNNVVTVTDSGMPDWKAQGLPVETGGTQ